MGFNIAIDGPSGAGKTTLAKALAKELGFIHVDTGAMYRAISLYVINNNIDCYREEDVVGACSNLDIDIRHSDQGQQVLLNGIDVTNQLRSLEVSRVSSIVSAYKDIRSKLRQIQREIARNNNVVMDGRDIGTNVLVDAQIKIFLEADIDIRAQRRKEELLARGIVKTFEEVKLDLEERDYRDSTRKNSPLRKAPGAVVLDSTNMSIKEEVNEIIKLYENKISE